MKRLWAMALGLSIVATVSAQVSQPLARLSNGEIITSQDVESYLASRPDLRQVARNAWGAEQAVGEMALTRVLMLEGQQRGIVRRNTQTEERFDNVYGMDVLRQQLPQCVKPADEKEARAYFDAHPKAFITPIQVRVQRIMLPVKTQVAGQASMAWLQDRAQAIASGGVKFAAVAEQAQAVYNLETHGDIGWIPLEDDSHLVMKALKTVAQGEMLGPVQDGELAYLFLVTQRREQRALTWEQAKSFAATRAEEYCRTQSHAQVRESLFQKYGVQIDREAIRALYTRP